MHGYTLYGACTTTPSSNAVAFSLLVEVSQYWKNNDKIVIFKCFLSQTVGGGGVTSSAPTQIIMAGIPPELAGRLKEGVAPPAQLSNMGILDVATKLKVSQ